MSGVHKEDVQYDVIKIIASALQSGKLSAGEAGEIAAFILERIDDVKTHEQMAEYITELSSKWPMFSNIASVERAEVRKIVEEEVTRGVLTLLEHGKVDHALALVKTMTGEDSKQ